jgi:hypothetical protein
MLKAVSCAFYQCSEFFLFLLIIFPQKELIGRSIAFLLILFFFHRWGRRNCNDNRKTPLIHTYETIKELKNWGAV